MLIDLFALLLAGTLLVPQAAPHACAEYEGCVVECETGQGIACRELGRFHLGWPNAITAVEGDRQRGSEADIAATFLERGCALEDAESCLDRLRGQAFMSARSMFRNRSTTNPNGPPLELDDLSLDEALEFATRACELAPGTACHAAGNYAGQIPVESRADLGGDLPAQIAFRMDRSLPLYERGCEAEDARACTRAAAWLIIAALNMDMDVDWRDVERLSIQACEAGVREACENWHDILNLADHGPYDPAVAQAMRLILCVSPRPCDPAEEFFNLSPETIEANRRDLRESDQRSRQTTLPD